MPLLTCHFASSSSGSSSISSPRILLETDAAPEEISPSIRLAADVCSSQSSGKWNVQVIPEGFDGVLTSLSGEVLVSGSPADLRHVLRVPGRRIFFAVHRPCLPELPFVTAEPRARTLNARSDYIDMSVRFASPPVASANLLETVYSGKETWAQTSKAVLSELTSPGSGIEGLLSIWQGRNGRPDIYHALAVRNLIVALMRLNQETSAEKLLGQAQTELPGYGDLFYIGALWHLRGDRPAQAFLCAEKARNGDRKWMGTGGEATFRADWLLGAIARRAGNVRVAFEHLRHSAMNRPPFLPAAQELFAMHVPKRLVEIHQGEFCRAAVDAPDLVPPVLDFFMRHGFHSTAEQLLRVAPISEELRSQLTERIELAQCAPHGSGGNPREDGITLRGPFFEHTSLARINRHIATALLDQSRPFSAEPTVLPELPSRTFPEGERLGSAIQHSTAAPALTIRHQWPPDFRRPVEGKLAVILPWEYGAMPKVWVSEIERNLDEVWVPSQFVADVLRRSGVQKTPIHVIPNGFDPRVFRSEGETSRPLGCRSCAFLFVGGAIRRKGLDLLLDAYQTAFDPGEDVTLVVHASGVNGSYQHNSLTHRLKTFAEDEHKPPLQIISDTLSDETLARVYRGCNALVLPYRGEGFGMPLVEAMACGTPVITTALGPAPEFCEEEYAYLLSAHEEIVDEERPPLGPLAGEFTWFEPDFDALVKAMRRVYENPADAKRRGQIAARAMRSKLTWEKVTSLYRRRIQVLLQSPILHKDRSAEAHREPKPTHIATNEAQ